ncbi:hypothetical protein FBQ82_20355 [Anaerolineae bacterium CFX7]|nr:hypothetical protein [Anaerolineae bacterium CFX7]
MATAKFLDRDCHCEGCDAVHRRNLTFAVAMMSRTLFLPSWHNLLKLGGIHFTARKVVRPARPRQKRWAAVEQTANLVRKKFGRTFSGEKT